MKREELLSGQPEANVKAAMQEEACNQCFGCPNATVLAAGLSHRADLLLNFTSTAQVADSELHESIEQEVRDKRDELETLTADCEGYQEHRTKDSPRPAKMCNSPEYRYHPMEIAAGRILELFDI